MSVVSEYTKCDTLFSLPSMPGVAGAAGTYYVGAGGIISTDPTVALPIAVHPYQYIEFTARSSGVTTAGTVNVWCDIVTDGSGLAAAAWSLTVGSAPNIAPNGTAMGLWMGPGIVAFSASTAISTGQYRPSYMRLRFVTSATTSNVNVACWMRGFR